MLSLRTRTKEVEGREYDKDPLLEGSAGGCGGGGGGGVNC